MRWRELKGPGWHLELDYDPPLLRACVTGGSDTSLAVTREYWLRILEAVRDCRASQLLVVDRMEGEVMDDADLARLFDALEGKGLERVRLAYVEGRVDQFPRIEHAEQMALERGYTGRTFHNETDAVFWLRHGGQ